MASEILIALLLYRCPHHVKQLKNDIRIACTNAYVRGLNGEYREIRLAISNRDQLIQEINRIHEKQNILCTVGAHAPQLLEIPFVSVTRVLECPPEKLKSLLRAQTLEEAGVKYSELKDLLRELAQIGYNMTLAGVKAARLARTIDPENQVGRGD